MNKSDAVTLSGFGQFFEAYGNGGGPIRVDHGTQASDHLFELDRATEERGVELPMLNFLYRVFVEIVSRRMRAAAKNGGMVDLSPANFEILYRAVIVAAGIILKAAIAGEIEDAEMNIKLAPKALLLLTTESEFLRKLFAAAINDAQVYFVRDHVRAGVGLQ